jgi:hypothetical protein
MGTDIHGVFQKRDGGQWVDVEHNYEMDRHYQLFAVLAGVRNGRGFAGVPTGEAVNPIVEPRGYPEDFSAETIADEEEYDREDMHPIASLAHMDKRRAKYHTDEEPAAIWMGDHSHSWLSGEEMLAWYQAAPCVVKTGILDRADYEAWDKKSRPKSYSGGVFGAGVVIINDNAYEREKSPNWTHIRCDWESPLKSELAYFFDEVKRLAAEHGEIRFVFGFDS